MPDRTRVKICGVTNMADALQAVAFGADALGFIFYARSPRYVAPSAARVIIDQLPPFVTPVAVMVNESVETISEIMTTSGCRVAQLHGDEPPELFEQLAWPAIKGIAVATSHDLDGLEAYRQARALLLDAKVAGQYGGTGTTCDWLVAREARRFGQPLILAGGLSPENVAEAIRVAEPDAVDISSGIERAPGRKDPERMRLLFTAITTVDAARAEVATARAADRR